MPNCFTLTRKSNPQAGPVKLHDIDAEMCAHFKVKIDANKWCRDWYVIAGFSLAMGETFDTIIERNKDYPFYLAAIQWLADNFTSDAFYQSR